MGYTLEQALVELLTRACTLFDVLMGKNTLETIMTKRCCCLWLMKLGFLFPTNKPTYSYQVGLLDLPNNTLTKKLLKDKICRLVCVNIANPMKVDLLGLCYSQTHNF